MWSPTEIQWFTDRLPWQGCVWELYGERRWVTEVTAEDRLLRLRQYEEQGLSFRVVRPEGPLQLFLPHLNLGRLLSRLGVPNQPSADPTLSQPSLWADLGARLVPLIRTTWPDNRGLLLKELQLSAQRREYVCVTPSESSPVGTEEQAEAVANWEVTLGDKVIACEASLHRASVEGFLEAWSRQNPFEARTEAVREGRHAWPAPYGRLPLYWAPEAVAQLAHLFLKGFEGDRVLEEVSFLNSSPLPLSIPLRVRDQGEGADHEGTSRREVPLFEGGNPLTVGTTRRLAERLKIPPTGHCRRESYRHSPQVGWWGPRIEGTHCVNHPLKDLGHGLAILDLTVQRFDPVSADLDLLLNHARIIHQGELGDPIEPLPWRTNLLHLLGSIRATGNAPRTVGIPVTKRGSHWVTEYLAPEALSEGLELPGAVPPSHYW